ncbi:4-phytase / acid phosphatase [Granulicella pectinivorans]|uniref:4-phytase / acid phosphatase n=1 Tax=Granulicella pectinivorans TaxID=474950 RepID=A0A1I6MRB5_9BACT|nr:histidine-type phosphatase [Granulicella pectinivorans]SFS18255.1 4-phytase / acid phosphatase [Granulicella pectinivorans]
MAKLFAILAAVFALLTPALLAQRGSATTNADLKFVVYFSRHGVRSPTGKAAQYDKFSSAAWPTWPVAPGILTPHGYRLMELFGAYDRQKLAQQGLFAAAGCEAAGHVSFYADSDQRTRETGNALAAGLFPGCGIAVSSREEGTNDPLFHLPSEEVARADSALAVAAIAGRIGGSAGNPTEAYRAQIATFDHLLGTCGKTAASAKRSSLFDVPSTLEAGQGDHLAELRSPLNTASTLVENILLEYTEGMDKQQVGWGCADGATIRSLIALHTAATDFTQRTPAIAKLQASNLLKQIEGAMQQAVEQHPMPGVFSKPTDKALFLVGHDTNILNMAGALNLTWIADERRDDTAPGSTLIFELWKGRDTAAYTVKVFLSVQTLEQMRNTTVLTLDAPPERVPVFLPGCSRVDFSCSWSDFMRTLEDVQR